MISQTMIVHKNTEFPFVSYKLVLSARYLQTLTLTPSVLAQLFHYLLKPYDLEPNLCFLIMVSWLSYYAYCTSSALPSINTFLIEPQGSLVNSWYFGLSRPFSMDHNWILKVLHHSPRMMQTRGRCGHSIRQPWEFPNERHCASALVNTAENGTITCMSYTVILIWLSIWRGNGYTG